MCIKICRNPGKRRNPPNLNMEQLGIMSDKQHGVNLTTTTCQLSREKVPRMLIVLFNQ